MKLNKHNPLQFRSIVVVIIFLNIFLFRAEACELNTKIKESSTEDIKKFFESQDKYVVTLVGYSGAGYEDKTAMLEKAGQILDEFNPSDTIVNIGATPDGIGAIYELAKQRGFLTTGIVSTQAKKYNANLSRCVDYVFYVEDSTWGGSLEGSDQLFPTSTAMVENSDMLIGIGGGEVSRDELMAAKRKGKIVRFIPADMNHDKAREKAQKKGLPMPKSFTGAADEEF